MTTKPADVRPLQRDGAGLCGCPRPDLGHARGCLWALDKRPGRGPKLTLSERVRALEALVIALEGRLVKLETVAAPAHKTPDTAAGGDSR